MNRPKTFSLCYRFFTGNFLLMRTVRPGRSSGLVVRLRYSMKWINYLSYLFVGTTNGKVATPSIMIFLPLFFCIFICPEKKREQKKYNNLYEGVLPSLKQETKALSLMSKQPFAQISVENCNRRIIRTRSMIIFRARSFYGLATVTKMVVSLRKSPVQSPGQIKCKLF